MPPAEEMSVQQASGPGEIDDQTLIRELQQALIDIHKLADTRGYQSRHPVQWAVAIRSRAREALVLRLNWDAGALKTSLDQQRNDIPPM